MREKGRSRTSRRRCKGPAELARVNVVLDVFLFCSLEPRSLTARES